ncbi:MAG: hypothetical protein HKN33_12540 [Pyrinomonadaceae bacterium]|nr:hypothetical protein [Pyrinomonadaceae bacterium]
MKSEQKLPLIIAHRGASLVAPENTMAAFERAVEDGAEGIEFDVGLTADGVPVVFHDSSLKRVANDQTQIRKLRLKDLSDVDIGTWFNTNNPEHANENFRGVGIPTLKAVLDYLSDFSGPIYVEIKSSGAESARIAEQTAGVLNGFPRLNLIVKSFDFETIPVIKKLCPDAGIAALFAPNIMRILRKEKRLVNITREIGAERLSLHFSLATKKLMKAANEADIPVTIWTVDSKRLLKRSASLGVHSVITNDPKRLTEKRDLNLNGYSII